MYCTVEVERKGNGLFNPFLDLAIAMMMYESYIYAEKRENVVDRKIHSRSKGRGQELYSASSAYE